MMKNYLKKIIYKSILFLSCFSGLVLSASQLSKTDYHVVVIDTYQMLRKASLNDELQKLHNTIINEKYLFYYCFYNTPFVAQKTEDMEKLFVNISNNNPIKINTDEDYLRLINLISLDDCFQINNQKVEMKYSTINFHFFFDTQNYLNTDIYKLFIRKFILFHQMIKICPTRIKYKLYFDENRYNSFSEDIKIKFNNSNLEILKY